MEIKDQVQKMDSLVSQGAIVDAVKAFFSPDASTSDYDDLKTSGKDAMLQKMEGFTGAIAKVNQIKHHQTITDGSTTASEFTFDFDMKDGSNIHWHEIIKRQWNDMGEVISETYFQA